MPTASTDNRSAAYQQIAALGERMDKGFEKLERILSNIEERVRCLENREAACQPTIDNKIESVERQVAAHDLEIKALRDIVRTVTQQVKWVTGIGSLMGSSVILWLVGKLLGLI